MVDPWFGTPFHFDCLYAEPSIMTPSRDYLSRISAIHISHIHRDHFCTTSLSLFPKQTPIVIGDYPNSHFEEQIRRLGFHDIRICRANGLEIKDLKIFNYPLIPFNGSFDSLCIIESASRKVLLNNDCILSSEDYGRIAGLHKKIDVGILGYASVSPFPTCYSSSEQDSNVANGAVKLEMRDHMERLNSVFQFDKIIPYANGIRVRDTFFPVAPHIFDFLGTIQENVTLKEKLIELKYLQKFDLESHKVTDAFMTMDERQVVPSFKTSDLDPLLPQNQYIKFFDQYFGRFTTQNNPSMTISIEVLASNGTQKFVFSAGQTEAVAGELTTWNETDISIVYPSHKLNQVIHRKASIASIYFSFDFKVTYKNWPEIPRHRIHRWFA